MGVCRGLMLLKRQNYSLLKINYRQIYFKTRLQLVSMLYQFLIAPTDGRHRF